MIHQAPLYIELTVEDWNALNSPCQEPIFRRVPENGQNRIYLRHVCPSICPYVRMEQLGFTGLIFMKLRIFLKSVKKFMFFF